MNLKGLYIKYKKLFQPILYCKNRLGGIKIRSKGFDNKVLGIQNCRMRRTKVSFKGNHNRVYFGDMSSVFGVSISIHGSNNNVFIGERNYLEGCSFCIEDDNNKIETGTHVYIYSNTEISAIESTKIIIGDDCLFSANIMIRTGDSHAILNRTTNDRVNTSKSIKFASRVWIGNGCKVLKGSSIGKECIIGTGSIITHKTPTVENCVLVGIPAQVVSEGVMWTHSR